MAEWIKLGSYLREQRRKAKLTLRDFANKVGVSELLLSNAERGIIDPMEFANVVFDNIAKKG
jgi:transcriptional regulator with XRE-family HTH domain